MSIIPPLSSLLLLRRTRNRNHRLPSKRSVQSSVVKRSSGARIRSKNLADGIAERMEPALGVLFALLSTTATPSDNQATTSTIINFTNEKDGASKRSWWFGTRTRETVRVIHKTVYDVSAMIDLSTPSPLGKHTR
ncbi:hypothetical protein BXZ70DRAFT_910528 [Cristinia sonorae]|uniref:Uncharacterized protein n=1 Tax=Cristinia sonorae TaxID=1940300 RepID=A0A8K0XLB8_9AGAR|nr:hypothetical protein BXZ70DRAFT_910528 [Cristinia sonorae]